MCGGSLLLGAEAAQKAGFPTERTMVVARAGSRVSRISTANMLAELQYYPRKTYVFDPEESLRDVVVCPTKIEYGQVDFRQYLKYSRDPSQRCTGQGCWGQGGAPFRQ